MELSGNSPNFTGSITNTYACLVAVATTSSGGLVTNLPLGSASSLTIGDGDGTHGGALELLNNTGAQWNLAMPITLAGEGNHSGSLTSLGVVHNITGNNVLAGAVTISKGGSSDPVLLTAESGSELSIGGVLSDSTDTTAIYVAQPFMMSSSAPYQAAAATGSLALTGTACNTFPNAVTVASGVLVLSKTSGSALGSGATLNIGNDIGTAGSAEVLWAGNNQLNQSAGSQRPVGRQQHRPAEPQWR